MAAFQQDESYTELPDGASPLAVHCHRAPAALDIRLLEDRPARDGSGRGSYPARLVGSEVFLVTLVTAADPAEGGLAGRVLDMLTLSLTTTH